MRHFVAAAACVALVACGGSKDEETPEPVETVPATTAPAPTPSPSETTEPEPVAKKGLELTTGGLVAGDAIVNYNARRTSVEDAVTALMGQPVRRAENGECGAGPMKFTDYPGGVTFSFQDDKLVGWNWRSPHDGDTAASVPIKAQGPAQLGTPRATVEAASGFQMFDDSTLGDEFQLSENLFGIFEAGKVSMLYSGTQCFFR